MTKTKQNALFLWALLGAAFVFFPSATAAQPSDKDREAREQRGPDGNRERELKKDLSEFHRELRKATEELNRELQLALAEAEREGKPEKFFEKQDDLLSKYDEKVEQIENRLEEKQDVVVVAEPAPPDRPRQPRRRPADVNPNDRESTTIQELRVELNTLEARIEAENQGHEARLEELRQARRQAERRGDERRQTRVDELIQREQRLHERKMARLQERRRELRDELERRTRIGRSTPNRLDAQDGASAAIDLDALERDIAAEEQQWQDK